MYEKSLTKKDIIAFNQNIGLFGAFTNESSLDYALKTSIHKKNWLYEVSHIVRSILIDHVFEDGNKRTAFIVVVFYCENNNKQIDKEKLITSIMKIVKKGITNPAIIMRLIYNAIR